MGREAKRAGGNSVGMPPFPEAEIERIRHAWNRAIAAGPMENGAETKYHFTPDGKVLSGAVGKSGQAWRRVSG
ncbi:hypothetical protein [Streptomyces huiliensis]|uniref:hypothetical protein n=1 Tax=Streptomyces huiliensis TaxID=2876027 RepID=UPI001CBB87C3|nr:hypothetical protein [Streptomyces huiliensis]MBZ4321437.1 hypothetical protein [Streptomyces huiliensis]